MTDSNLFLYPLAVVIFIISAGFFSSLETAFVCTEFLKIKRLKKTKPKAYNYLSRFLSRPERFLSTTLVGTNLSIIICSCLTTTILVKSHIENPSLWVSIILTPVVLIFAEMFPKNIGRVFQYRFIIYFLGLFRFLEFVLRPLVVFVGFLPSRVISLLPQTKTHRVSKDDIKILTEALHREGKIKRIEKEAIFDVLGFSQTRVKDMYVPLKKVVSIDYNDNLDQILKKAREYGFTRYPVFKDKKVTGYLNIFDLFYEKSSSWQDLVRVLPRVGISQRLDDVSSLLLNKKKNIALVLKGEKPYGILTTQDFMKEVMTTLTKK